MREAPAAARPDFGIFGFHLIPLAIALPLRLILRTQPRSVRRRLIGLLTRLRGVYFAWINPVFRRNIRFQKYRVAPRLGTDTVRRRLLFRLDQNAPLAATETGLA